MKNVIYRAIELWLGSWDLRREPDVGVVLHTSCVNYPVEFLRVMHRLDVRWILPDNVRWELRLLQQSGIYGWHAREILRCVDSQKDQGYRQEPGVWDLEQLYKDCASPITPDRIHPGTLLFAFGDLNKQDEFLARARQMPGHYILLHTDWACDGDRPVVMPLERVLGKRCRRAEPLEFRDEVPVLSRIPGIECLQYGKRDTFVTGRDFEYAGKSGNYARIYTSRRFPGRYVKIYTNQTAQGSCIRKLKTLAVLGHRFGPSTLALPETLLMRGEDELIGFSMLRFRGKPLREILDSFWEHHDDRVVLRRLILTLIELHCLHILVNDLSIHNIMVDDQDQVYLVDCDSFQVYQYPGGGLTEIYRHPLIDPNTCNDTLREPRHEYFAFAVLLFQCLMYCEPLMQRQMEGDERERRWDTMEFQLEAGDTVNPKVNSVMLELWRKQDPTVRKLWTDIFHFRADHSFGAWIRVLELLDCA